MRSVNALVGETNDGWALNDIGALPVTREHVLAAIRATSEGPFAVGAVGAGTGTVCFGWKGGIGSASRLLPAAAGGSCLIVVATDAPLRGEALRCLAARAVFGLTRTGSSHSTGSGDYAIAVSTAPDARSRHDEAEARVRARLPGDALSPLFQSALEATEEAVYDSLFQAVGMTGAHGRIEAIPIERMRAILRKYGRGR